MLTAEARRLDAYEKIQLGGLVVKAGLKGMNKAVILGILIDGERRARSNLDELDRYQEIGDREFG